MTRMKTTTQVLPPTEPAPTFTTVSGRPIKALYTGDDVQDVTSGTEVPGQFPYTRGIHSSGFGGKLWTMRQFSGFGTPDETTSATRSSWPPAAGASAWHSTCRR